ncbi:molybdate-anion transporter-like [Cimex lectularius]|uniref:Molybdate-anion transporter n=1 Tax=Cimex lectularius TaxID=79782 RepID=A0A8I6RYT5_CIMLE|nr:molybdate-anion transporter-like [Cimex lectularius]
MLPRLQNLSVKKWKTLKRHVERAIVGALVVDKKSHTLAEPHNIHYKNLQRCYIIALYLATFADWLQGPYIYTIYKDYGYSDDSIAILYITGFASSCVFGSVVGQLADRYGRKVFCSIFTLLYSVSCLTKTSPNFNVLLIGRILGGICTSILFTTFEAWYVNEHLNFYKLPVEWLNVTFTKATFYSGLSAILAGMVAQLFVDYFALGHVSPFILAIPFLLLSLLVIQSTWKEHVALAKPRDDIFVNFFTPLRILTENDGILLYLGLVQSIFESVMYTFIFSWTPILADLQPPLGLVFSLFMVTLMCGSKFYSLLISRRWLPQNLLIFTSILATGTYIVVTICLTNIVAHVQDHDPITNKTMSIICLLAFLVFEFSIGLYFPTVGYLRSRIIPEDYRATLANWFRVPMNIITCFTLTMKFGGDTADVTGLQKFQYLFTFCSLLMIGAILGSVIFSRKYSRKILYEELEELKTGKAVPTETV